MWVIKFWTGFLVFVVSIVAQGFEVFVVTNATDSGAGTLRQALTDTNTWDLIYWDTGVENSVITITNGSLSITNNVIIDGGGTAYIDAQNLSRIFNIESNATVTLSKLSFRNGEAEGVTVAERNGGAVHNAGNLEIVQCRFYNNHADHWGGAIYNEGQLHLDSFISNTNTAGLCGGTIYNSGNVTSQFMQLELGRVTGGTSSQGGAIYNSGQVSITDSFLSRNSSTGKGGSLFNATGGVFSIARCDLNKDDAVGDGGSIYNQGYLNLTNVNVAASTGVRGAGIFHKFGLLNLDSCSVFWNTAEDSGGGLYCESTGTVLNCTFEGNLANTNGGAAYIASELSVMHATVSSNRAFSGAGFYNEGSLSINNSIVAENFATNTISDIYGDCIALGTNIVQVQGGGVVSDPSRFLSVDPQLQKFGRYGNNVSNFYFYGSSLGRLPELDSPAIDGGETNTVVLDQRAYVRYGKRPDIGAIDRGVWMVNTLVDENDGSALGDISLRDALNEMSAYGYVDFDPSLSGQTIVLTNGQLEVTEYGVVIDGSMLATNVTLSGNDQSRIMDVRAYDITDDVAAAFSVKAIDFIHGRTLSGNGGGGALNLQGRNTSFELQNCNIVSNVAQYGGGIMFDCSCPLSLTACSLVDNQANYGGGIFTTFGYLSLSNCTVVGNGHESIGYFASYDLTTIEHCTFVGNTPADKPGGIVDYFNDIELRNNAFSSSVITNALGNFIAGTNLLVSTNAFAPLGYYNNRTQIMPPLPGSAVIDAAGITSLLVDQRGAPRVSGGAADLGSVEAVALAQLGLVDSDMDGIPDILEPMYGLVVGQDDSMADSDLDGAPDAEELGNMTNPLDSNSVFRILALHVSSNGATQVMIPSFPGLIYHLESDSNPQFLNPLALPEKRATNHVQVLDGPLGVGNRLYLRAVRD